MATGVESNSLRAKHSRLLTRLLRGVPVTGIERTVLDIAGVVGFRRLEWTVDAVLRQRLVEWIDLYDVLVRHSRRGRDGCGRLRALLDVRFGETAIPDSKWNRLVARLLVDSGLPAPAVEHEIFDGETFLARVDLAYPESLLAIEMDSARHNLNRESFESDPRRKNNLIIRGWQVLTFTWADFNDHPIALCATVRAALSQNCEPDTGQSWKIGLFRVLGVSGVGL